MKKIIFKKHHAFTIVELVFVIIVVGILSAILIPRMQSSRLYEAADQVTSHIRYTQHLAMMDDKFDPTGGDANWFKKRWQIFFEQNDNKHWVYTIFSDDRILGIYNGIPDYNAADAIDELATNPQDTSKRLTGGREDIPANIVTKALNLSREYDINGIAFNAACNADGATRITFDYLGRPMVRNVNGYASPYPDDRLLASQNPDPCTITLTNGANENINITIQSETGFVNSSVIY
ncbi:MAG: type II secretion system GspH family protein [Campylobacteraceae bacterium]|jgi:type II secretory pathway pseudopilin PulG|nr:type II secretion system GspH family protein [Campylobacteraceae bacterium]